MTDPKRLEEIEKRVNTAVVCANGHAHFHGRSGQTIEEMASGFYPREYSVPDIAFLLSELRRARAEVWAEALAISEATKPHSVFLTDSEKDFGWKKCAKWITDRIRARAVAEREGKS